MAPRTSITDEQRAEQIRDIRAQLDAQVASLRTPEGWVTYLAAAAALPARDLEAVLLIAAQNPAATAVASYGVWQARGRQVRKGEKALTILGSRVMAADPVGRPSQPAPGTELGPAYRDRAGAMVRRVSYPARIFDIVQTEPIKGAQAAPVPAPGPSGAQVDLYARVVEHFARQAITVRRLVVPGIAAGFCRKIPPAGAPLAPERYWIVEVVVDLRRYGDDAARTAIHEAAHITAGHLEAAGGDYVAHRGRPEVEACAAGFILETLAGLETTTTPTGYAPAWMQGATQDDLVAAATTVLATARALAAALALTRVVPVQRTTTARPHPPAGTPRQPHPRRRR